MRCILQGRVNSEANLIHMCVNKSDTQTDGIKQESDAKMIVCIASACLMMIRFVRAMVSE
jgi:hypothetical protein